MNKINILINFDENDLSYSDFLTDSRFNIDTRQISGIGSNEFAGALSEYDAIILNFENPIQLNLERYKQLWRFINQKDKLFILFLHRHNELLGTSNTAILGGLISHHFGISLLDFINIIPNGNYYTLSEQGNSCLFSSYLNLDDKEWNISFYNHGYNFVIPLAYNTENEIVSFSFKSDSDNYFLPFLKKGKSVFWEIIINYLINNKAGIENVDEWVLFYEFPGMTNLEKELNEYARRIEEINIEKKILLDRKGKLEKIRNTLLFGDGKALHDICKMVFIELGLYAVDGVVGREDLVIIENDSHFILEIKGTTKSASKKNISQLNSHITQYKNDNEVEPKGVLLINAWRELPLEERDTNDKPIFPEEIMKLVNLSKLALMTTQQLFVAYYDYLDGKFDKNFFIKELNSCSGILSYYKDISKCKKTKSEGIGT